MTTESGGHAAHDAAAANAAAYDPEDAGRLRAIASELASRGFEVRLTPPDRVPDKLAVTNPVSMHYAEVTDQDWVAWWAWADTPEDAGVTQIADDLTRILGRPE
jgi:hypothetical protein